MFKHILRPAVAVLVTVVALSLAPIAPGSGGTGSAEARATIDWNG